MPYCSWVAVDGVNRSFIIRQILAADANEFYICGGDQVLVFDSVDFSIIVVGFVASRSLFCPAVSFVTSTACVGSRPNWLMRFLGERLHASEDARMFFGDIVFLAYVDLEIV